MRGRPPGPGVLSWCAVRCPGRVCCAGAQPVCLVTRAVQVLGPPLWSNMLFWCVACLHGWVCVLVRGLPPMSGVRCWCVARCQGRLCSTGAGPSSMIRCAGLVLGSPQCPVCHLSSWLGDADAVATFTNLRFVPPRKKRFGNPFFFPPPRRPQCVISHGTEPSDLDARSVLLGLLVCSAHSVAMPLRLFTSHGAHPCSPQES